VKAFEDRAQCFVDQYSNFTVHGKDSELHVNGRLTLGENIADAGGLTAAYHAWKKRDEAHADPVLPGLSLFSKEQIFFISYANWWCSKTTPEKAQEAIYNDPHAPKPARIIVSLNRALSTAVVMGLTLGLIGYYGKFPRIQRGIQLSQQAAYLQALVAEAGRRGAVCALEGIPGYGISDDK
jgi:hypothetical protein